MKFLIQIIVIALAFIPLTVYSSQDKLPTPSFSKEWNKPEHDSCQLKKLLDEDNITQFYYISKHVIDRLYQKQDDPQSIEEIKDHLLIRWLIASAPFIDLDPPENVMWVSGKSDLDCRAKSDVIHRMALETLTNITPEEEKKFNINKKEAIDIYFSTFALILKQFRDLIDPDFETKRQQAIEFAKKNPKVIDTVYNMNVYFNRLSQREGRTFLAKSFVENMEDDLMDLLLKAYPTKAMMVKKYLAMAGYSPKEMPPLIDRTIGRIPAAHYLYKSLPKRQGNGKD